jgi:hypothetical protein
MNVIIEDGWMLEPPLLPQVTKSTKNYQKVRNKSKKKRKSTRTTCHDIQTSYHYIRFYGLKLPITCIPMSVVARSYVYQYLVTSLIIVRFTQIFFIQHNFSV